MEAQTWLDQNYPEGECINSFGEKGKKRSEIRQIYVKQQLEGELDLADFTYYGNSINGIGQNNPSIWKYLDQFTKFKF